MKSIEEFLSELRHLQVKLWIDEGRLRYSATPGTMTPDLLAQMKERKSEIMAFLEQVNSDTPELIKPVPRDKDLPLSFAQERLWFLNQLSGNSATYNITTGLNLQGKLHLLALEKTLETIIQRHEILRTNFISHNGSPIQIIADTGTINLPCIDLQHLPAEEQKTQVEQLVRENAQYAFDLAAESLLRTRILCLGEQSHILLLTVHHIISDGWSMGILVQEISTIYQAYIQEKPSPLTALPIQYADFALWQKQWLSPEVLTPQIDYWKQQLSGLPPLLELPTDKPRPAVQSFAGRSQFLEIPAELTQQLKQLTQQSGVTLYMTLLTVLSLLLSRYSRQSDIAIGSVIANRNQREIEALIGFFVNTLVLRVDLQENPRFIDLLKQVRQVALAAYSHQDLPFEKLVEELKPARSLSYHPLFQVMFVWQNTPQQQWELPGLTITVQPIDNGTAKFDLTLSMAEKGELIQGYWEYNTDLFEAETIERMNSNFQTLLAGIVANPQQVVGELPLLTQLEKHQLLVEWNQTQTDYPTNKCIHQVFEAQVEKTPDAVAVVFEDQQLTYRELNNRANQLAHYLQKLGVKAEVLVGICVERSLEMIIGLLGILKAGGAYVPLDPSYPQERLAFMLEDTQVPVLLTQQSLLEQLPEQQATMVCLDRDRETLQQESLDNLSRSATADNLAYVIYTSGSTGRPKGVLINHANVTRLFSATEAWYQFNNKDVWTLFHSYAFDFSVWELWGGMFYGGRVVIVPYFVSRSPEEFYQLLHREQVTVLNQTPSAFQQLMRVDETSENQEELSLRLVIFGGEALDSSSLKPWFDKHGDHQPQLVNMYGITETTVHVTYCPITQEDVYRKSSVIGCPIRDLQVYIVDRHLQLVPIGVPGEILVGGTGVSRGYLNRPELNDRKFIDNPFSNNQYQRFYRSGDLARYLPDGNIEYLGRIDNQVKIRGFRIELGEIEAILSQYPAVRETVVIVREDTPVDQRLVAYIVANIPDTIPNQIRSFLKEKLPDYMIPSAFVVLDQFPLTPNGKIDRRALPAPKQTRQEPADNLIEPRDELELKLTKIWEKVLNIKPIHIRENFFELGGHSLLAVQLFSQIKNSIGKDIPVATLFQAPTIEELAHILRQEGWSNRWSSLVPIQPAGSQPPFFFHGGAADAMTWAKFGRSLPTNQPFYGLQHPILEGKPIFQNSVEEMAAHCIKEIQTIQPNGPYFIGGHCFGGTVAFEIAQQLHAQGEKVALLVLVDAYAPKPLPKDHLLWRTQDLFHKADFLLYKTYYYHANNLRQRDFLGKLTYIGDWLREKAQSKFRQKLGGKMLKLKLSNHKHSNPIANSLKSQNSNISEFVAHEVRYLEAEKASRAANAEYLPQVYPEQIILVRASKQILEWYFGDRLGWSDLAAGGVESHEIPGIFGNLFNQSSLPFLVEKVKIALESAQVNPQNSCK